MATAHANPPPGRNSFSRLPAPMRFATGAIGALLLAWGAGFAWFAGEMPVAVPDPSVETDVIVVLTGGGERVRTGFELLEKRRAKALFISGVDRGIDVAELLRVFGFASRGLEGAVVLGYDAGDTAGNARETAQWMQKNSYRSLRLVTASYHMPRSLLELSRRLPETRIVPHPVFPAGFKDERWWRRPETTALLLGEYNKYLIARLRPWRT
jgi:uncharacterized SAM-binding protein YcdF (DUF218 family)